MKRHYGEDAEDWFAPNMRDFRLRCCSCGLIHDMRFRVNKKGEVEIKIVRNELATSAARRPLKKRVVLIDE